MHSNSRSLALFTPFPTQGRCTQQQTQTTQSSTSDKIAAMAPYNSHKINKLKCSQNIQTLTKVPQQWYLKYTQQISQYEHSQSNKIPQRLVPIKTLTIQSKQTHTTEQRVSIAAMILKETFNLRLISELLCTCEQSNTKDKQTQAFRRVFARSKASK